MSEQPRPTAGIRRVDLSASRPGASAEAALLYAYRHAGPRRRTEPCACGADIVAETGWEDAAVREHNATPVHLAWREWRETADKWLPPAPSGTAGSVA